MAASAPPLSLAVEQVAPPLPLAVEQVLALASARHPRLGAASPAATLPDDAMRLILLAVQAAHRELVETKRIVCVCAFACDVVQRIELHYSDGTHVAHGSGGHPTKPIYLEPGEFISRLCGRKTETETDAHPWLNAVTFMIRQGTDRPRTAKLHGRAELGHVFHYFVETGQELRDLVCAIDGPSGCLASVDDVVTQPTPWTSDMARLLVQHPSKPFAPTGPIRHRVGHVPFSGQMSFSEVGNYTSGEMCTFAEAKEHLMSIPGCVSFTFPGIAPTFVGKRMVLFRRMNIPFDPDVHIKDNWTFQTYYKADAVVDERSSTPEPETGSSSDESDA